MGPEPVLAELGALRTDLALAADALLFAGETGLQLVCDARLGDSKAIEDISRLFAAILEACAFQDITGQRLDKIERMLTAAAITDPLLSGPALHGDGLDQSAADALFAAEPVQGSGSA